MNTRKDDRMTANVPSIVGKRFVIRILPVLQGLLPVFGMLRSVIKFTIKQVCSV